MRLIFTFLFACVLISACKTVPDRDPHHLHEDPNNLIYFLILAPILVVGLLYFGYKLMNYLDRRRAGKSRAEKAERVRADDH